MTKQSMQLGVIVSLFTIAALSASSALADRGGRGDNSGHGSGERREFRDRDDWDDLFDEDDSHHSRGSDHNRDEDDHDDDDGFEIEFEHGQMFVKRHRGATTTEAQSQNATRTREFLAIRIPVVEASTTLTYGDAINALASYKGVTQQISQYMSSSNTAQGSFSSSLLVQIDSLISTLSPLGVTNQISNQTEKHILIGKIESISESVRVLYRSILMSL